MIDVVTYMKIMERSPQLGARPPRGPFKPLCEPPRRLTVDPAVREKYARLYPREETVLDRILGRDS